MHILPGDPILMLLTSEQMNEFSQAELDAMRHEWGLDKPLAMQYFDWYPKPSAVTWGLHILSTERINEIARRLPVTLHLGILAFILTLVFGIPPA
jgi:peptide/nickel transport system permease protein